MWSKRQKAPSIRERSNGNGTMTIPTPEQEIEIDPTDSEDKARGRQAWCEAVKIASPDEIMAGLERALGSQEWGAGPLGEGIPPMHIWLRSRGWERRYTPEPRC